MKARRAGTPKRASLLLAHDRKKSTKSAGCSGLSLGILALLMGTLAAVGLLFWSYHGDAQSAMHSMDHALSSFSDHKAIPAKDTDTSDRSGSDPADGYAAGNNILKKSGGNDGRRIKWYLHHHHHLWN